MDSPMLLDAVKALIAVWSFILIAVVTGVVIKRSITYFEDHPHASKNAIQILLYTATAAHLALPFLGFPWKHALLSLMGQILYISLFGEYPTISIKDARFVVGMIITIYTHFYSASLRDTHPITGRAFVLGYAVIWTNPLLLCLVLAAGQNIFVLTRVKRRTSARLFKMLEHMQSKQQKSMRSAS